MTIPDWEYDNTETGVILETKIDNLEGNQESYEPHADPFTNKPTQECSHMLIITTASQNQN